MAECGTVTGSGDKVVPRSEGQVPDVELQNVSVNVPQNTDIK